MKIVQRFLSTKTIGYQHNNGYSDAVMEFQVRFTDGSEGTLWQIWYTRRAGMESTWMLEECPRIDMPQPATPSDIIMRENAI